MPSCTEEHILCYSFPTARLAPVIHHVRIRMVASIVYPQVLVPSNWFNVKPSQVIADIAAAVMVRCDGALWRTVISIVVLVVNSFEEGGVLLPRRSWDCFV